MFWLQFRKRLIEKSKDGTLKAVGNGEQSTALAVSKKRGRWDQQQTAPDENLAPAKKKATWEAEVRHIGSIENSTKK